MKEEVKEKVIAEASVEEFDQSRESIPSVKPLKSVSVTELDAGISRDENYMADNAGNLHNFLDNPTTEGKSSITKEITG